MIVSIVGVGYRHLIKPILFQFDPELVHAQITTIGEKLGKSAAIKKIFARFLTYRNDMLSQNIAGINFLNPIGMSTGFDYEVRLTQLLPAMGFGFQSVGTITFNAYEGNIKPRLGRLPKSHSLMVNKGFKNNGAKAVVKKVKKMKFAIPIGISIGRTNNPHLSQKECITDISNSFKLFEISKLNNAYYELNISCPNLHGSATFYEPDKLDTLLSVIDTLQLSKPVFIKMPISCENNEIIAMVEIIINHKIAGVIVGNLQKDRKNKYLIKNEVAKFSVGNFSGKPTYERSNELIALIYKRFGNKLIIIGCGGIFTAQDAYTKIKKGAHLVQLITGLIYQGPQLAYEINKGLYQLLEKDGFTHISEAVGSEYKKRVV